MFELSFNDERYLPFEGAGAISSWHIEINTALGQSDGLKSTAHLMVVGLHLDCRIGMVHLHCNRTHPSGH